MVYLIVINSGLVIFLMRWVLVSDQVRRIHIKPNRKRQIHFTKGQGLSTNRNFYKIFKYLFTQADSGIHPEAIVTSLYKVIDQKAMKRIFVNFSSILAKNNQEYEAFMYLRDNIKGSETNLYVDIIERYYQKHIDRASLAHIDQMLFQKYLSSIRAESKRIERRYVLMVIVFTLEITLLLILPLLSQMVNSLHQIFY